jgi:hypothetical protein
MSSCSVIRGRHAKAPELAYESVDASVSRFADDDQLGCPIRPISTSNAPMGACRLHVEALSRFGDFARLV